MLEPHQISLFDYPELVGKARLGVRLTPSEIAAKYRLKPERSFDDLGYYDFLALSYRGTRLGFLSHLTSEDNRYSYVNVVADGQIGVKTLIAEICEVNESEIVEFDEEW